MANLWTAPAFLITLAIGLTISVFYLRYMWLALRRAVQTREDVDAGSDRYRHSLIGAIIAVLGSASAIAAYGLGAAALYLGPALAVASAFAVTRCLRVEYRDE